MKLGYVTTYDSRRLKGTNEWSGTGYYIARSLKEQSIDVEYLGSLKEPFSLQLLRKIKGSFSKYIFNKNYQKDAEPLTLKNYAKQIASKLNGKQLDVIFSATANPIAYLECKEPIVFWADGTFANIHNFYPLYSNLDETVIKDWHRMEELALKRCQLAIYSSDWAAESAIKDYGAEPNKVKVVPFGANIEGVLTFETVKDAIESRPIDKCKLIFIAVDWFRKGGDVAYQVTKKLNQAGLKTELTVIGCSPIVDEPLPSFVNALGFISKSTPKGKAQIQNLILESHFLILPTLADCTPIVLCEANSLGVPCLSTMVGGIPTMIHNDINGRLFDKYADISTYCDYILTTFTNYSTYKDIALSAYHEYESRLNWRVAGKKVKELLSTVI
ncbi:glycosyltransferase family 4 protein [Nostoc sp. FACHB-152]|uniref:glycosyltransferase family 4 protein n=1 Tax=unclassified Nostoc TaxID=2593658 RepID=UPI0016873519|nr:MULTISPECIES: glycosyltransferase family 4 protein [unclassified Nostoc]MBD2445793.1 glycosyltransferase family 4 protein [Nostoc sp. FACHB-152]MBD2466907.1 glycosyltransferase family 4 protein [Nostoc sp. FACHB-145]